MQYAHLYTISAHPWVWGDADRTEMRKGGRGGGEQQQQQVVVEAQELQGEEVVVVVSDGSLPVIAFRSLSQTLVRVSGDGRFVARCFELRLAAAQATT